MRLRQPPREPLLRLLPTAQAVGRDCGRTSHWRAMRRTPRLPTAQAVGRDCGSRFGCTTARAAGCCQRRRPSAGIVAPGLVRGRGEVVWLPTAQAVSRDCGRRPGLRSRRPRHAVANGAGRQPGLWRLRPEPLRRASRVANGAGRQPGLWPLRPGHHAPPVGVANGAGRQPGLWRVGRGPGVRCGHAQVANGAGRQPGLWRGGCSGRRCCGGSCQRRRPSAGIVAYSFTVPSGWVGMLPTAQAVSRDCGPGRGERRIHRRCRRRLRPPPPGSSFSTFRGSVLDVTDRREHRVNRHRERPPGFSRHRGVRGGPRRQLGSGAMSYARMTAFLVPYPLPLIQGITTVRPGTTAHPPPSSRTPSTSRTLVTRSEDSPR